MAEGLVEHVDGIFRQVNGLGQEPQETHVVGDYLFGFDAGVVDDFFSQRQMMSLRMTRRMPSRLYPSRLMSEERNFVMAWPLQ
ncbi:MAG: hypothetical protein VW268_07190 [Rhodospirillaceae bacterium]